MFERYSRVERALEKASDMFERWCPSLYNYKAYNALCQKKLRRTRKIGAFPSEQSLLRLVVTIMMDINEEWITGRNCMNLEEN